MGSSSIFVRSDLALKIASTNCGSRFSFWSVSFEACFPLAAYPWDNIGVDIKDSTLRCINNRDNGEITEHLCDGCDKFKELVKYQLLAANAKSALEREHAAKLMLMNHFKIFKIK